MPRLVQYTLQPVTSAECTGVNISRQSNGSGGVDIIATFNFEIKDEQSDVREHASTSAALTAGQRTQLLNFVTAVGVPQLNAEQEL